MMMTRAQLTDIIPSREAHSALWAGERVTDPPRGDHPFIYLSCLWSEANQTPVGVWVDAGQGADALKLAAENLMAEAGARPAMGCTIRDARGFGDLRLDPFTPLEDVARLGAAICDRGAALIAALVARFADWDEAFGALADYAGAYDSLAHFGETAFAERLGADATPLPSLDYGAMGAAMLAKREAFAIALDDDLHLFWSV